MAATSLIYVDRWSSKILLRAAFLLIALLPSQALVRNALGHKIVAEIAWQELSPAQRQEIVDTIRRHPRFADDFVKRMPADVAGDKVIED